MLQADLLVALSQNAYDSFASQVKPGGLVLVDSGLVKPADPGSGVVGLPFTQLARERVGKSLAASTVALGALAVLTGIVKHSSLVEAVRMRAPQGTEEINLKALQVGAEAAGELTAAGRA